MAKKLKEQPVEPPKGRRLLYAAVVIAMILLGLSAVYAMNLRNETRALRTNNDRLVNLVSEQKDLTARQLKISESTLSATRQQLEVSKTMLGLAEDGNSKLDASLDIQQRLLDIAWSILQQAREINRKMPPAIRTGGLPGL